MKFSLKHILAVVILSLAIGQTLAFAATDTNYPIIPKPVNIPGPSETYQAEKSGRKILTEKLLPSVASSFIAFVGALSLVMLIVAGVRFATAYGNDEAQTKAKQQVIYALVGLIISLLAYSIVVIVINIPLK